LNAKKRSLEFSLEKEVFRALTKENCYYCDTPPSRVFRRGPSQKQFNGDYTFNGIDRVDNTKGYTVDNCIPCCLACNYSKLDRTHSDFLYWIKKIYDHHWR
jgi:hypothetical protein